MPLRLVNASHDHEGALAQLQQLYLHDLSEFAGFQPDEDGRFCPSFFVFEDGQQFNLVMLRGIPAGFVCFKPRLGVDNQKEFSLIHLFIVRCYRRLGIGEEISRMLFEKYPGAWEVRVLETNEIGTAFMRQVLRRYTFKQFRELSSYDGRHRVFEFQSKPNEMFSDPV